MKPFMEKEADQQVFTMNTMGFGPYAQMGNLAPDAWTQVNERNARYAKTGYPNSWNNPALPDARPLPMPAHANTFDGMKAAAAEESPFQKFLSQRRQASTPAFTPAPQADFDIPAVPKKFGLRSSDAQALRQQYLDQAKVEAANNLAQQQLYMQQQEHDSAMRQAAWEEWQAMQPKWKREVDGPTGEVIVYDERNPFVQHRTGQLARDTQNVYGSGADMMAYDWDKKQWSNIYNEPAMLQRLFQNQNVLDDNAREDRKFAWQQERDIDASNRGWANLSWQQKKAANDQAQKELSMMIEANKIPPHIAGPLINMYEDQLGSEVSVLYSQLSGSEPLMSIGFDGSKRPDLIGMMTKLSEDPQASSALEDIRRRTMDNIMSTRSNTQFFGLESPLGGRGSAVSGPEIMGQVLEEPGGMVLSNAEVARRIAANTPPNVYAFDQFGNPSYSTPGYGDYRNNDWLANFGGSLLPSQQVAAAGARQNLLSPEEAAAVRARLGSPEGAFGFPPSPPYYPPYTHTNIWGYSKFPDGSFGQDYFR